MMMRHLATSELIDVAEGTAPPDATAHLSACAQCRDAVQGLRAVMEEARSVEVPEPSPLFWDHFSSRVLQAVAAEPDRFADRWWASRGRLLGALGMVAVVALLVVGVNVGTHLFQDSRSSTPTATAATAPAVQSSSVQGQGSLTPQDASLDLVAELSSGMDWDQTVDAGIAVSRGATDQAVSQLSTRERAALVELLKAQLDHSSS